ncbi:MAG TPA: hypothetical protein ENJ56_04255 [Anaerolineae bacterium]|nr:hypothetical protein [Anaerolineae bacterium]
MMMNMKLLLQNLAEAQAKLIEQVAIHEIRFDNLDRRLEFQEQQSKAICEAGLVLYYVQLGVPATPEQIEMAMRIMAHYAERGQ